MPFLLRVLLDHDYNLALYKDFILCITSVISPKEKRHPQVSFLLLRDFLIYGFLDLNP